MRHARVEVLRGERIESLHRVRFAISGPNAEDALDDGPPVLLRSAAKPFQAAAVVRSGALDRLGVGDETLAIVAASHSGEARHVSLVAALLSRLGLDESTLRCGIHPPFHEPTAARLGDRLSQLHHNCSGKHAGMLAAAAALGVSPASYLDTDGAVQQLMRRTVAAACGVAIERVEVAIDGCGAATFAVPLASAARAFALLASPSEAPAELREPLERVARAMRAHPHLVGGTSRFDTRLMEASRGRLIAKGGAEGVQAVADCERGLGMCLKVCDGAARAVGPAALEALRDAGMIAQPVLLALEDLCRPVLQNYAGAAVGRIAAWIEPGPTV
jgi:L-asparaginase II